MKQKIYWSDSLQKWFNVKRNIFFAPQNLRSIPVMKNQLVSQTLRQETSAAQQSCHNFYCESFSNYRFTARRHVNAREVDEEKSKRKVFNFSSQRERGF